MSETVGGAILLVGVTLFVIIAARTAFQKERFAEGEGIEFPLAVSLRDPQLTPVWLDRFKPWLIATVVLIVLAYGPQLFEQFSNASFNSPPISP